MRKFLHSWTRLMQRSSRPATQGRTPSRPCGVIPRLEALEDRDLLTTYTVTNLNDSGAGSLRTALGQARNGDAIGFAANVRGEIRLTSGQLRVAGGVSINGPGATVLSVVGREHQLTGFRVFEVGGGGSTVISGLTIRDGRAPATEGGGGIPNLGTLTLSDCTVTSNTNNGIRNTGTLALSNSSVTSNSVSGPPTGFGGYGAGIYNRGTLSVSYSSVSGNRADPGVDGIGGGGGIFNMGSVTVSSSTVSGNTAGRGGGILSFGVAVTVINSTFSGNNVVGNFLNGGGRGGAIYANTETRLTVSNSTFSGNSAHVGAGSSFGGGIFNQGSATVSNSTFSNNSARIGGGLRIEGGLVLHNTIVALNNPIGEAAANLSGLVSPGSSYNLIGVGDSGGLVHGQNGNQVGVVDPGLGSLADHGGPTETIDLLPGSPAIARGTSAGTPAFDQRGVPRGDPPSIGAYEFYTPQARRFIVSGFLSPVTAGTAGTVTVRVVDARGDTFPGYRGTVRFSSSDGQAILPANYTFTADDNGVHTFPVTLRTAGSQSLTATDTAFASRTGSQTGITVNAAAASQLAVSGFLSPIRSGTAGTVTVTVRDAHGNTATSYRGTVRFTSSDGAATLPANYTFSAADNGVHPFPVTLRSAGTQSINATDTLTATITGTQSGIVVTASHLVVSSFPSPVTAGQAGTVTVRAVDVRGVTDPGYRGTVRITSSDPQATLPANHTFTAGDNGQRTFTVTLRTASTQSITATDTVTATVTGTQTGITVTPAATSRLVVSGFPSPVAAGFAGNVTVAAQDSFGNATPIYRGTVRFSSSDPRATLPPDYIFTDADNGVHTFNATLRTGGTQSLTATDTVAATITGSQTGIQVTIPPPGFDWIRQFGTPTYEEARALGADASGVYVAGYTLGSLPGQTSAGAYDAFVRKYDANGNVLWTRQFGSAADDFAFGLGVDASGVYVTGLTGGTLPGQSSAGGFDAYVRKYDASGNEVWTRQFGTAAEDSAYALGVAASGVYVAGYTYGAFPGQTSAGEIDAYVRMYDTSGNLLWTRQFGSPAHDIGTALGVDATGVYVAGFTLGTLPGQTSAGARDAFVRKYDASGNSLWTRQFGSPAADNAYALAADAAGVYVAGYTAGTLPGQTSAGGDDAFVSKYDTSGNLLWTRQFGTPATDNAYALSRDASGVYVAGYTGGTLPGQTSAGGDDAFVRKYDATGTAVWSSQFGSAASEHAWALSGDATGVYVAGSTGGTLPGQTSVGGTDAYVAKLANPVSRFVVSGFSSPVTAGQAGTITVRVVDAQGATLTGYRGTVHFTSSDTQAVLPADYTFTAADNGVHTFTVTLRTAGPQSITATDTITAAITGSQTGITVMPAATSRFVVGGFPSPVTAGTAGNMTVTAQDPFGNTTPAYRGTVRFASSDAQAVLPTNYTFTAADNGVHSFSVTLKTAGTQSLTIADTTGSPAGSQNGIVVMPNVTAGFRVVVTPNPLTAGQSFNVTVTAVDAHGNTTPAYRGTVRFSSDDPQFSPPANYTFTAADNGTHTFTGSGLRTAGQRTLTVTDTLDARLTGSVTVTVNPAAASTLVLTGLPAVIAAGTPVTVTVTARDPYGNVALGYRGTVRFTSTDGFALLPSNYAFTPGDSGVHTFTNQTIFRTPSNSQMLTATDTVSGSISGQATLTVNPITVTASGTAGADTFVLRNQSGNPDLYEILLNGAVASQGWWVSLSGITLNGLGGGDTFTIERVRSGLPVTVNGGDGDDTMHVGTASNSLDSIAGPLALNGDLGNDMLNVNDQSAAGAQDFYLTSAFVQRGTSETVSYLDMEVLNVRSSAAGFTSVWVTDTAAGMRIQLTGTGSDQLILEADSGTFLVTAANAGTLTGTGLESPVRFTGMANLVGGPGDDRFAFADGQGVSGYVWGNGGNNTLDYTAWTTGVYVDLLNAIAFQGAAQVFDFVYIFGGAGDDYFHGDAQANWLVGNGGHDILVGDEEGDWLQGGAGNDQLYGGNGFDQLDGGAGEDLLIDGTTSYDNDDQALSEIWFEWTRAGASYLQRIATLRSGTPSGYVLDAMTVFSDSDADLLNGEDGLDWFWGSDGFDVMDRLDLDEVLN